MGEVYSSSVWSQSRGNTVGDGKTGDHGQGYQEARSRMGRRKWLQR